MLKKFVTLTDTVISPSGAIYPLGESYEVQMSGAGHESILQEHEGKTHVLLLIDIPCPYHTEYGV